MVKALTLVGSGSSPRVRGAGRWDIVVSASHGIIPACAGSRSKWTRFANHARDHPRVCGEQRKPHRSASPIEGSSPRVRGAGQASSPLPNRHRIIPACAGSRGGERLANGAFRDHPRVCGEQEQSGVGPLLAQGSSPRVRGAGRPPTRSAARHGIIPACAGSRYPRPRAGACAWDHPRVCGEQ